MYNKTSQFNSICAFVADNLLFLISVPVLIPPPTFTVFRLFQSSMFEWTKFSLHTVSVLNALEFRHSHYTNSVTSEIDGNIWNTSLNKFIPTNTVFSDSPQIWWEKILFWILGWIWVQFSGSSQTCKFQFHYFQE